MEFIDPDIRKSSVTVIPPSKAHPTRNGTRRQRLLRHFAFWLSILVIWSAGALAYVSARSVIEADEMADHAQDVRYQTELLLSLLKDAETGQRGYIITGADHYLEPYRAGLAKVPDTLSQLRQMTLGNPSQQQRLDKLNGLVDQRLDIAARNINLRRSQPGVGFDTARLDEGKAVMNEIRVLAAAMIDEETRLYRLRKAGAQDNAETALLVFLVGLAVGTLVIAGIYYMMLLEARRRRAAEAALLTLNGELDQRVQARTAEIERNQRFLAAILGNMRDAVYVRKDGKFAYANEACARLFGAATVEEVLGRSLFDFFQKADRAVVAERLKVLSTPGATVPVMIETITRLDGGTVDVEATAASFIDDSELAVLTILHDITERQALERRLRQAEKLEAIGQLTGGIAHDFNNLLTVILGNAESLAEEVREDAPLRLMAEMVQGAAVRAAELTHRLLAFSRKQALEPQIVDVNQQLTGIQSLMERTLGAAVQIEIVKGPSAWKALVDPGQLENAILNLAINARDAMPEGGRLTIETSNTRLDQEYADQNSEVVPGQYVALAVSDTGCGMPPEIVDKAFEPFFTTKEIGKGTGLGLSMVYGFVKQSGGHIKIYSELGEGTTIKLYLPRADAGAVAGQRQAALAEVAPRGTERIALVEDDAGVRNYIERTLRELGYTVRSYDTGPQLLGEIESGYAFDLLLTDVVLPGGMNGNALAAAVRHLWPLVKVLYSSGYTENAIVHQGRLDPGAQLLHKPFRKTDLARKVRSVLDAP
ncbi:CHASE3 domain-containing protein [Emcibacter sp. SYSU 3D8]|uniref:CHASE3 domain-containing protein n=1 Tax=Emcibacter sp. SYSU 3D8 TaxID=3133969 RepID=UPI0031FE73AE